MSDYIVTGIDGRWVQVIGLDGTRFVPFNRVSHDRAKGPLKIGDELDSDEECPGLVRIGDFSDRQPSVPKHLSDLAKIMFLLQRYQRVHPNVACHGLVRTAVVNLQEALSRCQRDHGLDGGVRPKV